MLCCLAKSCSTSSRTANNSKIKGRSIISSSCVRKTSMDKVEERSPYAPKVQGFKPRSSQIFKLIFHFTVLVPKLRSCDGCSFQVFVMNCVFFTKYTQDKLASGRLFYGILHIQIVIRCILWYIRSSLSKPVSCNMQKRLSWLSEWERNENS